MARALLNTSLRSRYSEVGLISSGNCGGEREIRSRRGNVYLSTTLMTALLDGSRGPVNL